MKIRGARGKMPSQCCYTSQPVVFSWVHTSTNTCTCTSRSIWTSYAVDKQRLYTNDQRKTLLSTSQWIVTLCLQSFSGEQVSKEPRVKQHTVLFRIFEDFASIFKYEQNSFSHNAVFLFFLIHEFRPPTSMKVTSIQKLQEEDSSLTKSDEEGMRYQISLTTRSIVGNHVCSPCMIHDWHGMKKDSSTPLCPIRTFGLRIRFGPIRHSQHVFRDIATGQ